MKKKRIIGHIKDDWSDFSFDDDESDEEQIKAIRLMIFEKLIFEGGI